MTAGRRKRRHAGKVKQNWALPLAKGLDPPLQRVITIKFSGHFCVETRNPLRENANQAKVHSKGSAQDSFRERGSPTNYITQALRTCPGVRRRA